MEKRMTDFTYELPEKNIFKNRLIACLKYKGANDAAEILKQSNLSLTHGSQYSRKRWNEYLATVQIQVPISKIEVINEHVKQVITDACNEIMPLDAGFFVEPVKITPSLHEETNSLLDDIEQISTQITQKNMRYLPEDIIIKGKEMTEVYLYLYCIENSLRHFIEETAIKKYGEEWEQELTINKNIRRNLDIKAESRRKNRWLNFHFHQRSFLYDIDFPDLGSIIRLNWNELFIDHFPDTNWITTKIKELGDCRNLVAHNGYLDKHAQRVIKTYYHSILRQLKYI